jgi:hypothetical protein
MYLLSVGSDYRYKNDMKGCFIMCTGIVMALLYFYDEDKWLQNTGGEYGYLLDQETD